MKSLINITLVCLVIALVGCTNEHGKQIGLVEYVNNYETIEARRSEIKKEALEQAEKQRMNREYSQNKFKAEQESNWAKEKERRSWRESKLMNHGIQKVCETKSQYDPVACSLREKDDLLGSKSICLSRKAEVEKCKVELKSFYNNRSKYKDCASKEDIQHSYKLNRLNTTNRLTETREMCIKSRYVWIADVYREAKDKSCNPEGLVKYFSAKGPLITPETNVATGLGTASPSGVGSWSVCK